MVQSDAQRPCLGADKMRPSIEMYLLVLAKKLNIGGKGGNNN